MSQYTFRTRSKPLSGAINKLCLVADNGAGKWTTCAAGIYPEGIFTVTFDAQAATDGVVGSADMLKKGRTAMLRASGAIALNAPVYTDDAGLITATNTGYLVGYAREAATALNDEIEVELDPKLVPIIGALTADSATLTAVTAETVMTTFTVKKNTLKAGDLLELDALIKAPLTNSTDTFQYRVRIGGLAGTVISDSTAIDLANGDLGSFRCSLDVQSIGATGKIASRARAYLKTTATDLLSDLITIDTTADILLVITGQISTNNAGNTTNVRTATLKRLRAA